MKTVVLVFHKFASCLASEKTTESSSPSSALPHQIPIVLEFWILTQSSPKKNPKAILCTDDETLDVYRCFVSFPPVRNPVSDF
jgi:hypothetical protein